MYLGRGIRRRQSQFDGEGLAAYLRAMKKIRSRAAQRTQAQRSQATTASLVSAASELFADRGFADVSLEEIAAAAGVTRGALYHHFGGKAELFQAVFEHHEQLLTAHVAAAAAKASDSWSAVQAGCEAFLIACLEPDIQRVVLIDGPSFIEWEIRRDIEARYVLSLLEGGLKRAMTDGFLRKRPVAPLLTFLIGALAEAAMVIARSSDPRAAVRDARRELDRWLKSIT